MGYAETMRILLLLLTYFIVLPVAAEVYRTVDENGNVIFTDKPSPGAVEVEIKEIKTVEPPAPETPAPETPATEMPSEEAGEQPSPEQSEFAGYTKLEITNPVNDTVVRDNAGNVTISVSLEPALNIDAGDQLVLYMDGARASAGTVNTFNLLNVDRGTHSFSVAVVNEAGEELMRSAPVSFTLLRHSSLQSSSTVGKPPKP